MTRLTPQPGPQTAFAATRADIAIFGGAAGGGKSWSLVAEGARVGEAGGTGIIFRRQAVDLTGGGSLWEETGVYASLGAKSRESPQLSWKWPSGGLVELRHLQHEKDRLAHQGKQYEFVGFDELTHFTEAQFWYLYSRARSVTGRFRPYIRATCNPDPDSFVRRLIDWWIGPDGYAIAERSGVLRWFVRRAGEVEWVDAGTPGAQSLTFIPSKLEDNAILRERDPDYESKLDALIEVDRDRLRRGNWNARDTSTRVYRYDSAINDCDLPADYDRERWAHVVAVDFGLVNDCAWAVLAAHPHRREAYVLETFKRPDLLPEQAAEITGELAERYRPDAVVGDAGGLGKPYVVAHNSRFPGHPMRAADKTEKRAHIKIFNGELQAGRVRFVRGACVSWVTEAQSLPWADEHHEKEHKAYPNHCTDAVLYGHRALNSYLNEAPTPPPPVRRLADDPDLITEEEQALQAELNRPWWDRD